MGVSPVRLLRRAVRLTLQRQRKQQQHAQRQRHRRWRPRPCNARGEVDMGFQQCRAVHRSGRRCATPTRHGHHCASHRSHLDGLRIGRSKVLSSGLGLFATRAFQPGAVVTEYTGDLIPTAAGDAGGPGFGGSHYVLELSSSVCIDAARTNTADGRLINATFQTGRTANVRFCCHQPSKTVTVKARTRIRQGDELLADYGPLFFE